MKSAKIRKIQSDAGGAGAGGKLVSLAELPEIRRRYRGQKVVQCHGVFDLLHAGHLSYFESARKLGDILVVTVTADRHVHKGPGHPYFPAPVRAKLLAGLSVVDYVCISDFPTAVPTLEALRPDLYVKGPDYRVKGDDVTGGILLEEAAVKRGGGKIVFTDDETYSSSKLLHRYFGIWSDEQSRVIAAVKAAGGMEAIEEALARIAGERVLVIGEPIIDTYVFSEPENLSTKSPCVSARFLRREDYAGGSLAIANHLADFAGQVTLLMTHGGEDFFRKLLAGSMDPRVSIHGLEIKDVPTPQKTRFLTPITSQRLFELTNIRSDQWKQHPPAQFCDMLLKARRDCTAAVVADFGHGLFEGQVLSALALLDGFVGLNVQTNSSNLGFNPFLKHERFSYLSADVKELRLAYHDRYSAPIDLARRFRVDNGGRGAGLAMTLGPDGSCYFPAESREEHRVPAFADSVVDTVGAGDAYFAITAMLARVGCPEVLVPFIGNVFAGLKAQIIGNKHAVPKAHLLKALGTILK